MAKQVSKMHLEVAGRPLCDRRTRNNTTKNSLYFATTKDIDSVTCKKCQKILATPIQQRRVRGCPVI